MITEHIADEAALVERLAGSEVVVAMRERTPFPRATCCARLPALRLLVTTGMANASIDLDAAAPSRASPCAAPAARATPMPELTIGMIIALTRNFAAEDAAVRAGGWQHTIGPGLAGATLGRRRARPARRAGRDGWPRRSGMTVIAWSPNLTPERGRAARRRARSASRSCSRRADVITIHMPLSDAAAA